MKKILLLFFAVLMISSFTRSANIPDSLERKYWMNLLRNIKLTPDLKPIHFQEPIKVELRGNFSKKECHLADSIINQLRPLIATFSIKRVSKNGNLILAKDPVEQFGERKYIFADRIFYKILYSHKSIVEFDYDRFLHVLLGGLVVTDWNTPFFLKNNIHFPEAKLSHYDIYYTKYEDKLIQQFDTNKEKAIKIIARLDTAGYKEGDVLLTSGTHGEKGFTAPDKFIIETIYAKDVDRRIKEAIIKYTGRQNYYKLRYSNEYRIFNNIYPLFLKFLFAILFLVIAYQRNRYRSILSYLLVGTSLFFLFSLYLNMSTFSNTRFETIFSLDFFLQWAIVLVLMVVLFYFSAIISKAKLRQWIKDGISSAAIFCLVFFLAKSFYSAPMSVYQTVGMLAGSLAFTVAYYLLSRMVFKQREVIRLKDEELSRLQMVKAQTELQALQSKLNPHFLYNSLNSLSHLVRVDADRAEKMTLLLSDLFRYTLSRDKRDFVELHEELDMVEKYLEVERVRFGDRLSSTIEADEQASTCPIPRLIVQPLVENAIKHGISKISGEGYIHIVAKVNEGRLTITVEDNGPAFPDAPTAGLGLQNIIERLQLLYGSDAELSWTNQPTKKVSVTIPTEK